MAEKTLKIASAAGSTLLLAGAALAAGTAWGAEGTGAATAAQSAQAPIAPIAVTAENAQVAQAASAVQRVASVEGTFAWTQAEVNPIEQVASRMGDAATYLCASNWTAASGGAAYDAWTIRVTGDVQAPVEATMGELAEEGSYHATMGCSCAGNGVDGLASVNAEVAGITVAYLLEAAGASQDANTLVFVSDDGYEVALPLSYVAQRASMVVYALNGAELANSVGGANQLWLGSTSARYFVRNVAEVRVETRDQANVPPVPGTQAAGDAYANVPNIGVVYGGEVA